MFTIIVSKKNIASMNIYESLKKIAPDMNFYLTDEKITEVDTTNVEGDYLIFASTHKSENKNKTLSVHPIGNWDKAKFGGEERQLSGSSGHLLKKFFIELNKQRDSARIEYECTLEATHHGPYVKKPTLFIEIGSSEEEWKDKKAGEVVARTILEVTKNFGPEEDWQTALAIGGGHYCRAFNKKMLEGNYAVSHICSKYNLHFLDGEMIARAIESTKENVDLVL